MFISLKYDHGVEIKIDTIEQVVFFRDEDKETALFTFEQINEFIQIYKGIDKFGAAG